MTFEVIIKDGWVWMTQKVAASSPEDALEIVAAQLRAANAHGDYSADGGEVLPAGTELSKISCGSNRRTVFA